MPHITIVNHCHLRGCNTRTIDTHTPLPSPPLHCTGLHRTGLRRAAPHCAALHCTALHCTRLSNNIRSGTWRKDGAWYGPISPIKTNVQPTKGKHGGRSRIRCRCVMFAIGPAALAILNTHVRFESDCEAMLNTGWPRKTPLALTSENYTPMPLASDIAISSRPQSGQRLCGNPRSTSACSLRSNHMCRRTRSECQRTRSRTSKNNLKPHTFPSTDLMIRGPANRGGVRVLC